MVDVPLTDDEDTVATDPPQQLEAAKNPPQQEDDQQSEASKNPPQPEADQRKKRDVSVQFHIANEEVKKQQTALINFNAFIEKEEQWLQEREKKNLKKKKKPQVLLVFRSTIS